MTSSATAAASSGEGAQSLSTAGWPRVEDRATSIAAAHAGMPALDVLRFLSVCAIAWYHFGGSGSSSLTFRLPAVALITALVQSRSRRWHVRGVLLPWLFWYALYGGVLIWRVFRHGVSIEDPELAWYNPFVGPAWHLWYGPFAFIAGYLAHRWRSERPAVLLVLAAGAFVFAFTLRGAGFPTRVWSVALPAIPIGILLASERTRIRDVALAVVLGFAALGAPYVIAIPLVWAATRWTGPRLKHLACLGRGVYWSHLLVADVLTKYAVQTPARALLLTFVVAGAFMLTPWTRRLV